MCYNFLKSNSPVNIEKTIFTGELEKEQPFFQDFFKEIFFKEQFMLCESLIMYFPSIFEIDYSLRDRFKRLFSFKTELKKKQYDTRWDLFERLFNMQDKVKILEEILERYFDPFGKIDERQLKIILSQKYWYDIRQYDLNNMYKHNLGDILYTIKYLIEAYLSIYDKKKIEKDDIFYTSKLLLYMFTYDGSFMYSRHDETDVSQYYYLENCRNVIDLGAPIPSIEELVTIEWTEKNTIVLRYLDQDLNYFEGKDEESIKKLRYSINKFKDINWYTVYATQVTSKVALK